MAFGRSPRQTRRERIEFRRRLQELESDLELRLSELGALALEMHRRNRIEVETLWRQAAGVAAIEDEAAMVRRAVDERLTANQFARLSRGEP